MKNNHFSFFTVYSIFYLILGAIEVFSIIFVFTAYTTLKEILDSFYGAFDIQSMDPRTAVAISLGFSSVLYLLFSYFSRRVVNSKGKGTIFMVLLIFSIVVSIVGIIQSFSIFECLLLIINSFALIYLFDYRRSLK